MRYFAEKLQSTLVSRGKIKERAQEKKSGGRHDEVHDDDDDDDDD